jgi:N-acetylglutamate synthase-like GNAT family acetyltransferase
MDFELDGDNAILHTLYVPPRLRRIGCGTEMFHNWFNQMPESINCITLKTAALGSGDTKEFWEKFGFKNAYCGKLNDEAMGVMVLGVNNNKTPEPYNLLEGETGHYIFGVISDFDSQLSPF